MLAEVASHSDELTSVVLGALTLAVLAVGAVFAGVIARRSKETAEAVHDDDGTSVTDLVLQRLDDLDGRLTRQSGRLADLEESDADAHRRIDKLARTVYRHHPGD